MCKMSDRHFKRKGYDLMMFSQWLHMPVPPFWAFVDSFPSDGTTRVATTTNRPRTSTTDHAQSGMAPMNNIRCMNDLVAERHMKFMKLNVLSIKTAVLVVRSSTSLHVVSPCERRTIISIASFE